MGKKVESCGMCQPEIMTVTLGYVSSYSVPHEYIHHMIEIVLFRQCCILFCHFSFMESIFSCHLSLCKHDFKVDIKGRMDHHLLNHDPTVRFDVISEFH